MENTDQPIIQFKHVGKCFRIYEKSNDRIKQIFSSITRTNYFREFWALKDICFAVKKGESFGIIGRNGSGKSTLLQMLCNTLKPTSGEIKVNGRIAAMLELGAGFNPEFTGKENVYLNGAILGFKKAEIDAKFSEIVAFADIGDFINQPVKNYSSGMFVRLAFSVQVHANPDILVVDEALSVGDIFFQQKCARRMQELKANGCTLIFVSHDMGLVRDLCQKAIYLRAGKAIYVGDTREAIRQYFAEDSMSENKKIIPNIPEKNIELNADFIEHKAIWKSQASETKKGKLICVSVVDENGDPSLQVKMGQRLKIQVLYQVFCKEPLHVTVSFRNRYDHIINATGTYNNGLKPPSLESGKFVLFELETTYMLEAGAYTFCVYLSEENNLLNRGDLIDESPQLGPINVVWDYEKERAPWLGMFGLPVKTTLQELN